MDHKLSSGVSRSFKVESIFMHSPVSKALDGLETCGIQNMQPHRISASRSEEIDILPLLTGISGWTHSSAKPLLTKI